MQAQVVKYGTGYAARIKKWYQRKWTYLSAMGNCKEDDILEIMLSCILSDKNEAIRRIDLHIGKREIVYKK